MTCVAARRRAESGAAPCARRPRLRADRVPGPSHWPRRQALRAGSCAARRGYRVKAPGPPYRGGEGRDWLECKVFELGEFVVTGFQELGQGRLEALHVAEEQDGRSTPQGRSGWLC